MNIFAKGISSYSNIPGSDSRLGFDSRTHGGVFGLGVRLYPKLAVGLGGGANLQVDNYDSHSFTTRLGLDLWQRFELEKIRAITPQVSIGWRREWIDPSSIKSRFSGGGTDFYTNSDHFSTNALTLGAALTSELSDCWNIDFKFEADIGDSHDYTHNISAGLQLKLQRR